MSEKCLLSTCTKSGQLRGFKLQGVKRLIECATQRQDNQTLVLLQNNLDSQGEEASVEVC